MNIPEIHELALEYRAVRDEHKQKTAELKKLKDDLLGVMKEKGIQDYRCDGVEAKIVAEKERVKVRLYDEDEDEDSDNIGGEAA